VGATEEEKRSKTATALEYLITSNGGALQDVKLFVDESALTGYDLSAIETKPIRVLSTKEGSTVNNTVDVNSFDESNLYVLMDEEDVITLPTTSSSVDIQKVSFDASSNISTYDVTYSSVVYTYQSGDTFSQDGLTIIFSSLIITLDRPLETRMSSRLVDPADILVDGEYVTDTFLVVNDYVTNLRGETIEEQRASLVTEQSVFFAQYPDVKVRYTNTTFFDTDVIMNATTFEQNIEYCTFSSMQFLVNSYDNVYAQLGSDGSVDGVVGSADVQHIHIDSTNNWDGAAHFKWSYRNMDIPEFFSFIDLTSRLSITGPLSRVGDKHSGCQNIDVFDTSTIFSTVSYIDLDVETMEVMFDKLLELAASSGVSKVDVDEPCSLCDGSYIITSDPTEPDFFDLSYPTAIFKCEEEKTCYLVPYNSIFTIKKESGSFTVSMEGVDYVFAENDEGTAGSVLIKTSYNYVAVTVGTYTLETKTHDEMVVSNTRSGNDNINSVNIVRYGKLYLTTPDDNYGTYIYEDGRTEYFDYTRGYRTIEYSEPVRLRYVSISWTGQYSGKAGNHYLILGSNDGGQTWEHFMDYNAALVPGKVYTGQSNSNIQGVAKAHYHMDGAISMDHGSLEMNALRDEYYTYTYPGTKVRPWYYNGVQQFEGIPYNHSFMAVTRMYRGPHDSMSMRTYTLELGHGDHALNGLPNNGKYYSMYRFYLVDGWISVENFNTDNWVLDIRK